MMGFTSAAPPILRNNTIDDIRIKPPPIDLDAIPAMPGSAMKIHTSLQAAESGRLVQRHLRAVLFCDVLDNR